VSDDSGELLPDGRTVAPKALPASHWSPPETLRGVLP
jgi:hypothetical protein